MGTDINLHTIFVWMIIHRHGFGHIRKGVDTGYTCQTMLCANEIALSREHYWHHLAPFITQSLHGFLLWWGINSPLPPPPHVVWFCLTISFIPLHFLHNVPILDDRKLSSVLSGQEVMIWSLMDSSSITLACAGESWRGYLVRLHVYCEFSSEEMSSSQCVSYTPISCRILILVVLWIELYALYDLAVGESRI